MFCGTATGCGLGAGRAAGFGGAACAGDLPCWGDAPLSVGLASSDCPFVKAILRADWANRAPWARSTVTDNPHTPALLEFARYC